MREEKRSEIIQDALEFLDDEMIEEVEKMRGGFAESDTVSKKTIYPWRKWTALAASVCLLMVGNWIFGNIIASIEKETPESVVEDNFVQNEEEQQEEIVSDVEDEGRIEYAESEGLITGEESTNNVNSDGIGDLAVDMLGFFIYQGDMYSQYDFETENQSMVGNYVTTIEGYIDEWTPADEYEEGRGTFSGDVYEIKGIEPEFMLCTIWSDGRIEIFINRNNQPENGSILVNDYLDISNNFATVSFYTDDLANETIDEPVTLSGEYDAVFQRFLDAFAEGKFAYIEGKSDYPFGGDLENAGIYHLYFTTENGVKVRFVLLGDGYVKFPWLNENIIKIDNEIYDEVVDVLEAN